MSARSIRMVDLFAGAGGTSTGAIQAFEEAGRDWGLTAINHWDTAVATHSKNHPEARHLCASLDALNPRDFYKPGDLDLLWASPECTHHSAARGGKPMNDQSRATAWCVVRWAEALLPPVILIENVREFETWGPIGSNGRPLKSRVGETFHAWLKCIESVGYKSDWKVLCSADYGDPTTRKRLFVQFVRGRRKIIWPEATHTACFNRDDLFGSNLKPWRAAREIIDWSDKGKSIFDRKKPLAPKTMNRIMIGLQKFGLAPFVASWDQQSGTGVWSQDAPLSTVTTKARHGVVEPFLIETAHGASKGGDGHRTRSINQPLPTITCGHETGDGRSIALCEPFLIGQQSGATPRSVKNPVPTVAAAGAISLVQPFLVGAGGPDRQGEPASIDRPLRTVMTRGTQALIQPFLVGTGGPEGTCRTPKSVDEPMGTVLTENHQALVQPFILPHGHPKDSSPRSVDVPLNTVTATSSDMALVEPYLIKFYSTGGQHGDVDKPLDTVTTKARFGLCMPTIRIDGQDYKLDIRFRMLKLGELAAAQGFPQNYYFAGNTADGVKQAGNAVTCGVAKALVRSALTQL